MRIQSAALVLAFAAATIALPAQSFEPLRAKCEVSPTTDGSKLSLHIFDERDCPERQHCGSDFSSESMNGFTGITLADLASDDAHAER